MKLQAYLLRKNDFLKRSMEIYAYETTINRCLSNLIFDPLGRYGGLYY